MKLIKQILAGSIFALVLIAIFYSAFHALNNPQAATNAFTVAVIGSGSGDPHSSVEDQQNIVEIYKGLTGEQSVAVHYIYYDDNLSASEQQEELAEIKSAAALIIGDHNSPLFSKKGALPHGGGIPVLSTSARLMEQDELWYHSLLPSYKSQAIFLANYIEQVLGYTSVVIIQEQDADREIFSESFQRSFLGLGGQVDIKSFDATDENTAETLDDLVNELINENTSLVDAGEGRAILINTSASMAIDLISDIKHKSLKNPIIGTVDLSSQEFKSKIGTYTEETIGGKLSQDVYAMVPFIFDMADDQALRFQAEYQKNGDDPTWEDALYYDTVDVANRIFEEVTPQTDITVLRDEIKSILKKHNKIGTSFDGIVGYTYFDKLGHSPKPYIVGRYSEGHLSPAFIQIQPIRDESLIEDLEGKQKNGEVLLIDSRYFHKTNVVYVGIDVNEMRNLNIKDSTYTVDFYLWVRYHGNVPDVEKIQFLNSVSPIALGEPVETRHVGDSTFSAYRIVGDFKADFDFHDYPFDTQKLEIRLRNPEQARETLIYVVDLDGMKINDIALSQRIKELGSLEPLAGWNIQSANAFQDSFKTDTTLGNPQLFKAQSTNVEYSRFNIVVEIKRNATGYVIKSLLPLVIVLVLAYFAFYLPLGHGSRLGTGTSALLTTGIYHLGLANSLPQIGYTVVMEYFFYTAYALSGVLVLFETISLGMEQIELAISNQERKEDYRRKRVALNSIGRVIYPMLLVCVFGVIQYKYDVLNLNSLTVREASALTTNDPSQPTETVQTQDKETVVLKLGAWRPEDAEKMAKFLDYYNRTHPGVVVKYDPIKSDKYDESIRAQLEYSPEKTADIFYVRSYSSMVDLYQMGYLDNISDLPGLRENFRDDTLSAWSAGENNVYAVPFIATSHGIYYNVDKFKELNIEPPTTWDEFMTISQTIQESGYIPLANGTSDDWADAEIMFMNMAPTFIGGRAGRLRYESGVACYNDPKVISAFQAMQDISGFLPENQSSLGYSDSQTLFKEGKALMFMSGSWEIPGFAEMSNSFEWSVFPVPAPADKQTVVTFHYDAGIGLNSASPHKREALDFLEWLISEEAATALGNELPGFFPMYSKSPISLSNTQANQFLSWNQKYKTDVRWAWPLLRDGRPSGYDLMASGTKAVINSQMTPEQAANELQNSLALWFEPAQTCLMNK